MHTVKHTNTQAKLAKRTFKTDERIFTYDDDVINILIDDIMKQICKHLCLGQTANRNEKYDKDGEKEVEIKGMARGPPL